jgi:hypothetical protein
MNTLTSSPCAEVVARLFNEANASAACIRRCFRYWSLGSAKGPWSWLTTRIGVPNTLPASVIPAAAMCRFLSRAMLRSA